MGPPVEFFQPNWRRGSIREVDPLGFRLRLRFFSYGQYAAIKKASEKMIRSDSPQAPLLS